MRRNILCVVSRPAVAKMRSMRNAFCLENRGFCLIPISGQTPRPACGSCFAETITVLHIVIKFQGLLVPEVGRVLSSLAGLPTWGRQPSRPAALGPLRMAAGPGAISFPLPLAVLSPAAMMDAPCPFLSGVYEVAMSAPG